MFERFTAKARAILVESQGLARGYGHSYLGTEHMLLALARPGSGVAADVLAAAGLGVEDLEPRVLAHAPRAGAVSRADAEMLLGLGIDAEALLSAARQQLGQSSPVPVRRTRRCGFRTRKAPVRFTPKAKRVLENALEEASSAGSTYIGTEHVLLGLLRTTDGLAMTVLEEAGCDVEALRDMAKATLKAA